MTAISLRALSKSFDGAPALRGINLDVAPGQFVSLLGPSGCGKTTLLRLIAGLEAPDGGEIRLDGQDMAGVAVQDRNLGFVFQDYALFPHMRVRDNVGFGLSVRGCPPAEQAERVAEMLEVVQLDTLADRFPAQLSGGQRQRVALARTLVTRPRVLMLDEPLANLDAGLRAEMRDFLREMHGRLGLTTLLVTHDQDEALQMSDRVAVLLAGQVAQVAAPETLYRRPASAEVARFMRVENLLPGALRAGRLHLAMGDLPAPGGHAEGPVLLALRAEAIGLAVGPEAPGFVGEVLSVRFQGASQRCVVDVAGTHLTVTAPARASLDPGTRVGVNISETDLWVLSQEAVPEKGQE